MQKRWGLKVALFYDQNGYAYRGYTFQNSTGTGLAAGDVLYRLTYLNLPVMAEYADGGKIKYYLNAGIFPGVLLKNQSILRLVEPQAPSGITESRNTSGKAGFNFGIALGAGVKIPLSSAVKLDIG